MPYNEEIDLRIKSVVSEWNHTTDKKMFGGTCHLLNGNMFCGVYKDYLMLRLGEEQAINALHSSDVRPFDITGRPMKGWVMVPRERFKTQPGLQKWLQKARSFVEELPPK